MTRNEQLKMLNDIAKNLAKQDLIMEELKDIRREQLILRRLVEGTIVGGSAEDSEEVDLDDVPIKEVDDV